MKRVGGEVIGTRETNANPTHAGNSIFIVNGGTTSGLETIGLMGKVGRPWRGLVPFLS